MTIARRHAGDISLPVLTCGSMRFDPRRIDTDAGRDLLAYLLENGVDAIHSSHEYEFHDYFCSVLRSLGKRRVTHIVKLGEPHFDHSGFRPERMIKIVDEQLHALGVERLDIIQWLLRTSPLEDRYRLPLFETCRDEVEATAAQLIEAGKIGMMTVFPYTAGFAEQALPLPWCRGLVSYLNPAEQEFVPYLDEMQKRRQFYIAIRPLLAGKLFDAAAPESKNFAAACDKLGLPQQERLAFALHYPLLHPAVCSIVLSMSNRAHAEQVVGIVRNINTNPESFFHASAIFAESFISQAG